MLPRSLWSSDLMASLSSCFFFNWFLLPLRHSGLKSVAGVLDVWPITTSLGLAADPLTVTLKWHRHPALSSALISSAEQMSWEAH